MHMSFISWAELTRMVLRHQASRLMQRDRSLLRIPTLPYYSATISFLALAWAFDEHLYFLSYFLDNFNAAFSWFLVSLVAYFNNKLICRPHFYIVVFSIVKLCENQKVQKKKVEDSMQDTHWLVTIVAALSITTTVPLCW